MRDDGTRRLRGAAGCGARIAVVDDDSSTRRALSAAFFAEGFKVDTYSDGVMAFETFRARQPDLAMIDLAMPRMGGLDLLEKIRESWSFPVIVLTAHEDEVDEVLGLRMGADDYVRKPCSMRMLAERVRARLRTARPAEGARSDQTPLRRGALVLDPSRHSVGWNGRPVDLTATEFQLLRVLAERPGHVRSRSQLMDAAYDDDIYVDDRTIDSHIKRLRKKFRETDSGFAAIETVYGIGYRYADDAN